MIAWIYWDPNPEAFELPFVHLSIFWYGILFALGFALAFPIGVSILRRFFEAYHKNHQPKWRKLAQHTADRLILYLVIATILGARLGHFIFYETLSHYLQNPLVILQIRTGGLASHGAVIAIILSIFLFCRRNKIEGLNWLKLLDIIVVPTSLVACFIRIGNFINQEVLGTESHLPWAVYFGHPADAYVPMVPRHPVQLYEALFYLAVFVFLFYLSRRSYFLLKLGKLTGLFLILIFGFRFCVEFFKLEQSHVWTSSWITMGQFLSIPVVILGIFFYFWDKR